MPRPSANCQRSCGRLSFGKARRSHPAPGRATPLCSGIPHHAHPCAVHCHCRCRFLHVFAAGNRAVLHPLVDHRAAAQVRQQGRGSALQAAHGGGQAHRRHPHAEHHSQHRRGHHCGRGLSGRVRAGLHVAFRCGLHRHHSYNGRNSAQKSWRHQGRGHWRVHGPPAGHHGEADDAVFVVHQHDHPPCGPAFIRAGHFGRRHPRRHQSFASGGAHQAL